MDSSEMEAALAQFTATEDSDSAIYSELKRAERHAMEQGVQALAQVVEVDDGDDEAHSALGAVKQFSAMRYDEKHHMYVDTDTYLLESDRGAHRWRMEDGGVVGEVQPSIAMNGEDAEKLKEQGNAQFRRGNYAQAVEEYSGAIALDPANAVYLSNRSMAFLKLDMYEQARDDASSALAIDPQHVKSLLRRGHANLLLGDVEPAEMDVRRALELEPRNTQGKALLQKIQQRKKQETKQSKLLAQASSLSKGSKRAPKTAEEQRQPLATARKSVQPSEKAKSEESPSTGEDRSGSNNGKSRAIVELLDDGSGGAPHESVVENSSTVRPASPVEQPAASSLPLTSAAETQPSSSSSSSPSSLTPSPLHTGESAKEPRSFTAPRTAYEFEKQWTEIQRNPLHIVQYIQTIAPSNVVRLFSNGVSYEIFVTMVKAISTHMEEMNKQHCFEMLQSITETKRFSLLRMFLSGDDKDVLSNVLERCESDGEKASAVKVAYGIAT